MKKLYIIFILFINIAIFSYEIAGDTTTQAQPEYIEVAGTVDVHYFVKGPNIQTTKETITKENQSFDVTVYNPTHTLPSSEVEKPENEQTKAYDSLGNTNVEIKLSTINSDVFYVSINHPEKFKSETFFDFELLNSNITMLSSENKELSKLEYKVNNIELSIIDSLNIVLNTSNETPFATYELQSKNLVIADGIPQVFLKETQTSELILFESKGLHIYCLINTQGKVIHAELTGCKDTQNRDISTIEFPEIENSQPQAEYTEVIGFEDVHYFVKGPNIQTTKETITKENQSFDVIVYNPTHTLPSSEVEKPENEQTKAYDSLGNTNVEIKISTINSDVSYISINHPEKFKLEGYAINELINSTLTILSSENKALSKLELKGGVELNSLDSLKIELNTSNETPFETYELQSYKKPEEDQEMIQAIIKETQTSEFILFESEGLIDYCLINTQGKVIHAELTGCKDTQNRDISTIEFPEIESKPILTNSSSSEVSTKNNVEEIVQEMSADKIDQITESIASKNSVEIYKEDKLTSITNSSSSEVSTKNNVEEIAQEMSADKIDQITESIASKNSVEIHEEDKLTSITNSGSSEVVIESKLEEIAQEMSQDMINQITQSVASANIIEMLSLQKQITNQLESASTVNPDNAIEIFGETFSGSYSTIDSPKISNKKNNEKIHVWRSEKNRTTNDYNFYKLRQDNKFELVYEKVDDGPTLSSGTSVSSGLKKANINIQALNEDSTPAYGFNLSNLEETISEKPEIKKAPFELTTYFNNEAYTYTGTFIQQDNSKLLKAEAKNKETNQVSVIILWNPDTSETCVKELTGEPITQTCKSFN